MKYQPDIAIRKATDVFWDKGYQGTKMRDLQMQMDMRPGSIYAGFGNKEGLFLLVLESYVKQSKARLAALKSELNSPLAALKAFVEESCLMAIRSATRRNCLLVKTLTELEGENETLASAARQGLKAMEQAFTSVFQDAINQQEMGSHHSAEALAKQLQIQIFGLRIYACSQPDEEQVLGAVNHMFDSLNRALPQG